MLNRIEFNSGVELRRVVHDARTFAGNGRGRRAPLWRVGAQQPLIDRRNIEPGGGIVHGPDERADEGALVTGVERDRKIDIGNPLRDAGGLVIGELRSGTAHWILESKYDSTLTGT